jgi:hypothetical protein
MPLDIDIDTTFEQFVAEYRLPTEDARTREMYEDSVNAAKVFATLSVPACPAWCVLPEGHAYEFDAGAAVDFYRWHASRDDNGPQVRQIETNHAGERIEFQAPEIIADGAPDEFSSEGARGIAAQFITAADLLDTISGALA